MAGETVITVVGNLTGDPELRFAASGSAVANFTVASTARTFNKQTNGWEDGDPLFLRCSIWNEAAENVCESLTKGTRVIVQGRLKQRSYEKDGQKRTVVELDVDEIGPSLKWASAKLSRNQRSSEQDGQQDPWASYAGEKKPAPWGAPADTSNPGPWAKEPTDTEPPF